ncbi:inner nuclear membrane protein enriched at telomere/subtelomere region [Ciborinia camelliae]|nr:inner nuclear membrane protein enriched at telomere/subtelomere region [Ciborinia camelliae]
MISDDLDYLQPGFDPYSLTMPRIRSILVTHNINYPSNANKGQLVEIFNVDLVPQARKILRERDRAVRTSRGIVDVESSQESSTVQESTSESTTDSAQNDALLFTPRTRPVRQAPAKVRASVEIRDDEPAMLRTTRRSTRSISPVKRIPRASSPVKRTPKPSSKHPRQEEEESGSEDEGRSQTERKSRKSTTVQTPMFGTIHNLDGGMKTRDTRRETNFSSDNPFQRGSPPPADVKRPISSHDKKRQSTAVQTPMSGMTYNLDGGMKTRDTRRETNFSSDNPFQRGSPPSDNRRPISSHDKKKKSLGSSAAREMENRVTSVSRRRTPTPQANVEIRPPTSSTFQIPISRLDGLGDYDDDGVETSEDFTPEAQFELEREQQRGRARIQSRRKTSNGASMSGPIWMILITLLAGYATWYRQEKIAVGFCGVGREAHSIIPIRSNLPDWVQIIAEPQCDWCPQHAYCNTGYEVQCDQDFVLKHHPLSMGGFLPLPPTCEPDGEKVRRIKVVADRAVEALRERRAKWECGDLVDEAGVPEPTVEIDTEALKKEVGQKRRKGMGDAEFEDLWTSAIGEVKGRDEVVVGADGSNKLTSTSFARLPLKCAIKRSFRLTLARYYFEIGLLGLLLILFFYIRSSILSYNATKAMVPDLVSLALSRLITQASLYEQDPETVQDSFISIVHLRDDILRHEHNYKKRDQIWSKVKKVVEMNSNVRISERQNRKGEVSRVWEWIGLAEDLEDSVRRKRAERLGLGDSSEDREGMRERPISERERDFFY